MPRKPQTTDIIIKRFKAIHSDQYDYSKVNFTHMHDLVTIICNKHGDFLQLPSNHIAGSGCKKCSFERQSLDRGYGVEGFISKAKNAHGDRYDYSLASFRSVVKKVDIICSEHGVFSQTPELHIKGHGCPACGGVKRLNTASFIQRSQTIHGLKYDYSLVDYKNLNTKVKIICIDHGVFEQMPCNHLAKNNCPKCSSKYRKQDEWLDSLDVPKTSETRQVRIYFEDATHIVADGFDPETNTVYEFWGDRWHGNPRVFAGQDIHPVCKQPYSVLYEATQSKINRIKQAGYNLIDIWECDWNSHIASRPDNL